MARANLLQLRAVGTLVLATALAQTVWDYLGHWGYWSWVVIGLCVAFLIGTFFLPKEDGMSKKKPPNGPPDEPKPGVGGDVIIGSQHQKGGETNVTVNKFYGPLQRSFKS